MITSFQYDVDGQGISEPYASGTENPAVWLVNALGGGVSDSGVRVNAVTSLQHGPLWQGINILAGDQGFLPLVLMRQDGDEVEEDFRNPSGKVIWQSPNEIMRPNDFRELMVQRAILWGNGLAWINRNPLTGRPQELLPLPPSTTWPEYDEAGNLYILTRLGVDRTSRSVTSQTEEIRIPYQDVLHLKGLTSDGVWGYSLTDVAKNTIGYGLALQKHGNNTFRNAARPSGVLEHPGKLTPDARSELREQWERMHRGVDNSGRVAILQEAMKFAPMSISNEDAQWLEAKKLDREEVASLLNIPAHRLNALERATFSNIEEQNRNYLASSLGRWLNKWVEECSWKLLTRRDVERQLYFWKWKTDKWLMSDIKSRYEAYNKAIAGLWMNPNEVRAKEGMNPRPGGDEFENPNTTSPAAEPAPAPEPEPEEEPADDEQNRKMLALKCHDLTRLEATRIRGAARSPKRFCQSVDDFYTDFRARLEEVILPDAARAYCDQRRQEVLGLADGPTTEFKTRVSEDSKHHKEHARQLVNLQYGGKYNGR